MTESHHYSIYGLKASSELECPELLAVEPVVSPDICIRLGCVPERLLDAREISEEVQVAKDDVLITIRGMARFLVSGGSEITVEPDPIAEPSVVRALLLGFAMGVLLHQRGCLPLHCCAVVHRGKAYAFCGHSGAGKSTLAAGLNRRGCELMCDDLGVLRRDSDGQWLFYPGFPRIKLWRDTLNHFSIDPEALNRDWQRQDKFHWQPGGAFELRPLPLGAVYFLTVASPGDAASIRDIRPQQGVALLLENTYRVHLINAIGEMRAHFLRCTDIAQKIQVFEYRRPWSLGNLDASLDVLPMVSGADACNFATV